MEKFVIILFLFLNFLLNAQIISGKIWSKDEQKPIPYANIGVENSKRSFLSDDNGNFSINLVGENINGYLFVEVSGYEKFQIPISKLISSQNNTINLQEKVHLIEELIINPKIYVDRNWGNKTTSSSIIFTSYSNLQSVNKKKVAVSEVAVFFKSRKRVKVNKINICVAKFESDKPVFLRYAFYDENMNSLAREDIVDELTNEKIVDKVFSSDISKYNVWMKDNFYVGVQIIESGKSTIGICGAMFGNKTKARDGINSWEKIPVVNPAINIDVKIEK